MMALVEQQLLQQQRLHQQQQQQLLPSHHLHHRPHHHQHQQQQHTLYPPIQISSPSTPNPVLRQQQQQQQQHHHHHQSSSTSTNPNPTRPVDLSLPASIDALLKHFSFVLSCSSYSSSSSTSVTSSTPTTSSFGGSVGGGLGSGAVGGNGNANGTGKSLMSPDPDLQPFLKALAQSLFSRYKLHWNPKDPEQGSGYRALQQVGTGGLDDLDEDIRLAAGHLRIGIGGGANRGVDEVGTDRGEGDGDDQGTMDAETGERDKERDVTNTTKSGGGGGGYRLVAFKERRFLDGVTFVWRTFKQVYGPTWTVWVDPGCVAIKAPNFVGGLVLEVWGSLPREIGLTRKERKVLLMAAAGGTSTSGVVVGSGSSGGRSRMVRRQELRTWLIKRAWVNGPGSGGFVYNQDEEGSSRDVWAKGSFLAAEKMLSKIEALREEMEGSFKDEASVMEIWERQRNRGESSDGAVAGGVVVGASGGTPTRQNNSNRSGSSSPLMAYLRTSSAASPARTPNRAIPIIAPPINNTSPSSVATTTTTTTTTTEAAETSSLLSPAASTASASSSATSVQTTFGMGATSSPTPKASATGLPMAPPSVVVSPTLALSKPAPLSHLPPNTAASTAPLSSIPFPSSSGSDSPSPPSFSENMAPERERSGDSIDSTSAVVGAPGRCTRDNSRVHGRRRARVSTGTGTDASGRPLSSASNHSSTSSDSDQFSAASSSDNGSLISSAVTSEYAFPPLQHHQSAPESIKHGSGTQVSSSQIEPGLLSPESARPSTPIAHASHALQDITRPQQQHHQRVGSLEYDGAQGGFTFPPRSSQAHLETPPPRNTPTFQTFIQAPTPLKPTLSNSTVVPSRSHHRSHGSSSNNNNTSTSGGLMAPSLVIGHNSTGSGSGLSGHEEKRRERHRERQRRSRNSTSRPRQHHAQNSTSSSMSMISRPGSSLSTSTTDSCGQRGSPASETAQEYSGGKVGVLGGGVMLGGGAGGGGGSTGTRTPGGSFDSTSRGSERSVRRSAGAAMMGHRRGLSSTSRSINGY